MTETLEQTIERAGRALTFTEEGPNRCRECNGEIEPPATTCESCAAKAKTLRRVELAMATVPELFRWAAFASPELPRWVFAPEAITRARGLFNARKIVFFGKTGRGKTTLAAATMRERVARMGEVAVFAPYHKLAIARARTEESDPRLVSRCIACDLLVIDDLSNGKDFPSNPVEDVIRERHNDGGATWVTTWMTQTEMGARYGGDIARRVYDRALVIDLDLKEAAT